MATNNGVLILLPVLNERQNIEELLDRIGQSLAGIPYTVCIVDDGSKDGTAEYLEKRLLQPGHHLHLIRRIKTIRGSQRGSALRVAMLWGLAATRHDIFVEIDGDLSHQPEELPDGIVMLRQRECDIAIASKYVAGSRVTNRPWGRLLVSRICGFAVRTVIAFRVRDYSNGYRFYTRSAAELAARHDIRYASPIYLTEVLALWLRCGLRVGEFRTTYVGRNEGISKLRFGDLAKAAVAIFEVSLRYHFTGFKKIEVRAPQVFAAAAGPAGTQSDK
ncbi:MAG TPA: glycosyltransferase [Bryobacteraceae bacterium]